MPGSSIELHQQTQLSHRKARDGRMNERFEEVKKNDRSRKPAVSGPLLNTVHCRRPEKNITVRCFPETGLNKPERTQRTRTMAIVGPQLPAPPPPPCTSLSNGLSLDEHDEADQGFQSLYPTTVSECAAVQRRTPTQFWHGRN